MKCTLLHKELFRIIFIAVGTCPSGDAAFDKVTNTNANGATRATNYDTYVECRDYCLSLSQTECVGFDHNRVSNPEQCWVHDNVDNIQESNRRSNNDVDLYIRKPCGMISSADTSSHLLFKPL